MPIIISLFQLPCRSKFPGFLGINTTSPLHEGDPYMSAFTFDSYQDLQVFLSSKERKQLMIDLLPLLEATSVAQISGTEFHNFSHFVALLTNSAKIKR